MARSSFRVFDASARISTVSSEAQTVVDVV